MKKININPVGLKGKEINERIIQLMGKTLIQEEASRSVVELTKIGPDGKAYGVVRENHEYYIKVSDKTSNLIAEDFKYIGGLQNKKSVVYPSYAKAIKQLNLTFKSLAEAYGQGGDINIFVNDKLMKENMGVATGGFGFSNQGNLDGNSSLYEEEELDENGAVVEEELEEEVLGEVDLSEDEAYVDAMLEEDDDEDEEVPENKEDYTKQPGYIHEKKK